MFQMLEENYGIHTLWEWVKDYIENERELAQEDEKVSLEEYLLLRAGNYDEGSGT